ncbi:MAG: hypothetical protein LQ340_002663, partial [Diploschistes diacapsis]
MPPALCAAATEHLSDFGAHAWCRALLSSPHHTAHRTLARSSSPSSPSSACQESAQQQPRAHALFSASLATPSTIRAVQSLRQRRCAAHGVARPEWLVLYSLGAGLAGPRPGVVQGGLLMALLDAAGAVAALLRVGGGCCARSDASLVDDAGKGAGRNERRGRRRGCAADETGGDGVAEKEEEEEEEEEEEDVYAPVRHCPVATLEFRAAFRRRVNAPAVVLARA